MLGLVAAGFEKSSILLIGYRSQVDGIRSQGNLIFKGDLFMDISHKTDFTLGIVESALSNAKFASQEFRCAWNSNHSSWEFFFCIPHELEPVVSVLRAMRET